MALAPLLPSGDTVSLCEHFLYLSVRLTLLVRLTDVGLYPCGLRLLAWPSYKQTSMIFLQRSKFISVKFFNRSLTCSRILNEFARLVRCVCLWKMWFLIVWTDAARKIHLTKETQRQLLKIGGFVIERRGEIYIKVDQYCMLVAFTQSSCLPGMLKLEAKIFDLVASGLGLVLMQCWPRSHEGCPRGLVVSHRNHVIYVTFFPDRKLLIAL